MATESTTTRPNILLIVVDQWRADCLGLAKHPVVETPHLDNWFHGGYHFTNAYSSTPTCVPARVGLLTGLSPRHHGFVSYHEGVPWNYEITLPGLLADAGYHTQCVGKMHACPRRNLVGFHNVVLHDGYLHCERRDNKDYDLVDDYNPWLREKLGTAADYIDTGLGCNGYVARPWAHAEMLHPSSWVVTQSIDFLRRRDTSKPFFLKMSFHRPHPPLDPPKYYLEHYLQKELPEVVVGDWAPEKLPRGSSDSPIPHDDARRDYARRAYFAQLTHIDQQLNRLMMELHHRDVYENTALFFVSDHGEMLYDHNLIAKGLPYEGSAGIPFLFRPPGVTIWDRGEEQEEITAPVELRDILPTCCDLAGIPIPDSIDGKSVLPLCNGDSTGWREYVHGEHLLGLLGEGSNQWLTDGREKYIWFTQTGREMYFDLANDPTELHDAAAENPERVAYWREHLIHELTGREEGFVRDGKLVVGCEQNPTLIGAGVRMER